MPPLRRYLRISAHTVLEVRIYLDNPADGPRWFLQSSSPALPRVIQAVRPLILPKIREEENASTSRRRQQQQQGNDDTIPAGLATKGKGASSKAKLKDVVNTDEFSVSIFFLSETGSGRHSLVVRQRQAKEEPDRGAGSNVINVEEDDDDDGEGHGIQNIPLATDDTDQGGSLLQDIKQEDDLDHADQPQTDALFVSDDENDGDVLAARGSTRAPQRPSEDKKKLAFNTFYNGFSIYGRILCLVVKRKAPTAAAEARRRDLPGGTGQAMMEEWIASTQMQREAGGMIDD